MAKPTLYLMLGYPGAGKTTASRIIARLTKAEHLWADHVRRELFGKPTYSGQENDQLYSQMNLQATTLLAQGRDVVFDTGFNYFRDRAYLRKVAAKAGADTVLVWVTVDQAVARTRATTDAHLQDSRALGDMAQQDFDRLTSSLEPPQKNEPFVELDGTKITPDYIADRLGLQP